ncbi:hypothetical protein J6TS7_29550 [Paenibacillus dendritiformis]|uniref:hypothetical protein n=1 Tax=Paenibacillus TaxID=44249 RepID=UPI001B04C073|nr:hypothetical protein [Paenibacillus dendritiformis]GIO79345.1 hypothetical protein J6TS7_29550 [Paenibacillus dendritiformis]
MKNTYPDFIFFARTFEEMNHFEFDEKAVQVSGEDQYYYDATYRDNSNYKTNVRIQFDAKDGEITWEVADGWKDAYQELEDVYRSVMLLKNPDVRNQACHIFAEYESFKNSSLYVITLFCWDRYYVYVMIGEKQSLAEEAAIAAFKDDMFDENRWADDEDIVVDWEMSFPISFVRDTRGKQYNLFLG